MFVSGYQETHSVMFIYQVSCPSLYRSTSTGATLTWSSALCLTFSHFGTWAFTLLACKVSIRKNLLGSPRCYGRWEQAGPLVRNGAIFIQSFSDFTLSFFRCPTMEGTGFFMIPLLSMHLMLLMLCLYNSFTQVSLMIVISHSVKQVLLYYRLGIVVSVLCSCILLSFHILFLYRFMFVNVTF